MWHVNISGYIYYIVESEIKIRKVLIHHVLVLPLWENSNFQFNSIIIISYGYGLDGYEALKHVSRSKKHITRTILLSPFNVMKGVRTSHILIKITYQSTQPPWECLRGRPQYQIYPNYSVFRMRASHEDLDSGLSTDILLEKCRFQIRIKSALKAIRSRSRVYHHTVNICTFLIFSFANFWSMKWDYEHKEQRIIKTHQFIYNSSYFKSTSMKLVWEFYAAICEKMSICVILIAWFECIIIYSFTHTYQSPARQSFNASSTDWQ